MSANPPNGASPHLLVCKLMSYIAMILTEIRLRDYWLKRLGTEPSWLCSLKHLWVVIPVGRILALSLGTEQLRALRFIVLLQLIPGIYEYVFAGTEEEPAPDSVVCAGGSVIISPSGTILAGPNYDGEALISADLSMSYAYSLLTAIKYLYCKLC
ncbi:hypothetical protein FF1_006747 [Malus domestica]